MKLLLVDKDCKNCKHRNSSVKVCVELCDLFNREISPAEFNRIMWLYQEYLSTFKDPKTVPCSPYDHLMLQLEIQQVKK
jgi:hypothetical protein